MSITISTTANVDIDELIKTFQEIKRTNGTIKVSIKVNQEDSTKFSNYVEERDIQVIEISDNCLFLKC